MREILFEYNVQLQQGIKYSEASHFTLLEFIMQEENMRLEIGGVGQQSGL